MRDFTNEMILLQAIKQAFRSVPDCHTCMKLGISQKIKSKTCESEGKAPSCRKLAVVCRLKRSKIFIIMAHF